ncbi:SRPBCC family protein [Chitinophaga sp. GbtcB8]|uniref:SRPBCC family protein n=1 Tax=Chitinophaga sp. GbtcB8 TaxID=2824753 RepID=UPI001C2FD181|nr:SRPBCC family protein [Chitinophaga sp. GbtcB8]
MAKTYLIQRKQFLPVTLERAWEFFSTPANLQAITPPDMHFVVKEGGYSKGMYPGLIIEYTIRPILGIPLYWMTEITHVDHLRYFVDEQRFGPYAFWHHQHHFKAVEGGVEMTDIVHYRLPFGFLGTMAHALFVGKQLEGIFTYRTKVIPTLVY